MDKMIGHDPKRKKWAGGCEGGCCTTKRIQRIVKKGVKQRMKAELRKEPRDD